MTSTHRRIIAATITALLLTGGVVAPLAASTASAATGGTSTGVQPGYAYDDGHYIVTLRDEPAATYDGGTGSFAATRSTNGKSLAASSAKVKKYASYLKKEQREVAASVGATIVSSYTLASNGFSGKLTGEQATALSRDSRVVSIVEDEIVHVQAAEASTDFLKLSGDTGVWQTLGGIAAAGAGVVIADIDTGIAPENPSFAGDPLGTVAGAAPYLDGDSVVYTKADGSTFRGECVTGEQFTIDDCSTKIIGARYFVDNFGLDSIKGAADGEYVSPRDGGGHGSHTASTAAGNNGVTATIDGREMGEISGVAPAAKLAIYKVCWTGIDEDGCSTGDLIAAIDAAVADNVDVINFSIGGGAAETTVSATGQAFLGAAAAGIFVAASAGNDGDKASTADNAAPWITTVAASTVPSYEATVLAGDGATYLGGSITLPTTGSISGTLVSGRAGANTGASSPNLCAPNSLDPAKVTGKIVLCERGTYDRVAKSAEVKRAGGIAMVLVNTVEDSIDLDLHTVPTIHVDVDSFAGLRSYASTANPTVTFQDGNTSDKASPAVPQVAGFSSRGPILADGGDILKPDITAPGVAILADGPNAADAEGTFEFMSGTSMSAPHITGLAALYLGKRPNASPAEIKSAMMTTAYNTLNAAGEETEDPFAQGAGQVDPTSYFEPGLLYLNDMDDWEGYIQNFGLLDYDVDPIDPSELNLASISIGSLAGTETITRTVTATHSGTFTAQPVEMAGVEVTVAPETLTFDGAGDTATYTVTFDRTDAPLDEFVTGYLRWTSGATTVTSPLAVRPILLAAPADVLASGNSGSAEIPVLAGETTEIPVAASGLVKGEVVNGVGTVGGHASYVVDVPEGTSLARFDLDTHDDAADFDLHVYYVSPFGGAFLTSEALTENADERIDISAPDAVKYVVDVDFFEGDADLAYTLTSYTLNDSLSVGNLSVAPETLAMTLGETAPVTAAWSGLEPGSSYLARVSYEGSDVQSFITVTTDPLTDPLPAVGELAVSVDPGWVRPGRGFALLGTGLVPGEKYDYYIDSQAEPLASGFATSEGTASRYMIVPEDAEMGARSIELRTADGTVVTTVMVSPIAVVMLFEIPDVAYDGTPTVRLDAIFGGFGTLQTRLEDVDTGEVYIDTTVDVVGNPIIDSAEAVTDVVRVKPGNLRGTVWSLVDGVKTQEHVTEFTAEARDASTLAISEDLDDPESIDVDFNNTSDSAFEPVVEYKTCAGPMVVAMESFPQGGQSISVYDLRGITEATITLDGTEIGSWKNERESRCADVEPTISQDFWLTMTTDPTGDPTKPIYGTITNRYAAYSYGYDLRVGTGKALFANQFYFEAIPVDYVVNQGPLSSREFALAENQAYWFSARYESLSPNKHLTGIRRAFSLPVTLADLAPVNAPVDEPTNAPTSAPSPSPTPTASTGPVATTFTVKAPGGLVVRGTTIAVTATGLDPNEAYSVVIAGKKVAQGVAGAAGKVTTRVVVPAGTTIGDHSVKVVGAAAARSGTDTIDVIAKSTTLKVRASKATRGKYFTVKVSGLGAREPVTVTIAGHRVSAKSAKASASGTYVVKVKAPKSIGSKVIKAVGQVSTRVGKLRITVVR